MSTKVKRSKLKSAKSNISKASESIEAINIGEIEDALKSTGNNHHNAGGEVWYKSALGSIQFESEMSSTKTNIKKLVSDINTVISEYDKAEFTGQNSNYSSSTSSSRRLNSNLSAVSGTYAGGYIGGKSSGYSGGGSKSSSTTGKDTSGTINSVLTDSTSTTSKTEIKDKIFKYLSSQGFNSAAICGIMANIEHESNFNPNSVGDGGTSYGICQWHSGRWTNLKNYCNSNNLNWKTLEGQLAYLVHELKTNYSGVYNTLKSVPNTSEGAYKASSAWTINFEVPANKYGQAATRGATAKTSYWNTYGNKTK